MTETEVERKIVNYLPRRVSLTITASTRSEFTIPAFSSIPSTYLESIADNLTVYHNGLLLIAGENYTVDVARGKIIFKDYQADVGDTVTVMGLAGAASIDFSEMAREAIEEIQQAVLDAEETIDRKITEIQEFINQLPDDTSKLMAKNTNNVMDAGYKITMGANYSPSSNNDVATKGSVATQISTALSSMATSIW